MIDDDTFIETYIKFRKQRKRFTITYTFCPRMSMTGESYKLETHHD